MALSIKKSVKYLRILNIYLNIKPAQIMIFHAKNKKSVVLINALMVAVLIPIFFMGSSCCNNPTEPGTRFDFGDGKPLKNFVKVTPGMLYSEADSFGFLRGADLQVGKLSGNKDRDYISSRDPFIFLADVPEGNYNISLTAVGMEGNSLLTIKTESRRLIVQNLEIPEGETKTIQFTTNVRRPEIGNGKEVRRKPREYGHFNWDRSLSIEINGVNPAVSSLEITRNETAITVFLAGNSTVTDQKHEPYSAWGQMLPGFFKSGRVAVANHAESGEALKSFIGEKRLEKLLSQIRSGDYLFIQFAHNDQKTKSSAYAAPFGDYQDLLKRYISEARSRGATPVLVTPMLRRSFDEEGLVINTHGDYPEAMRQVAKEVEVTLIDLFAMSKVLYETLGPEDSKKLFLHYPMGSFPGQEKEIQDNSHHSTYGAYELAKCVVKGLRESQLELADYLLEDLPDFDPSHPDPFSSWDLPLSPSIDITKPDGN